jgi:hypothetical protein
MRQRTRRIWPGLNPRGLAVTRACPEPELASPRRSPRTTDCLLSSRITSQGRRRNGTNRRSAPGMIRPARSPVPSASRRGKGLRAKALVPRADGSRPTRPRSPDRSPSNSAPIGQSMCHLTVRGPRLKRRHRTPQLGPSQGLPAEPSDPPRREDLMGRAGMSLPKLQRTPSRRPTLRTPSLVNREPAALS